MKKRYLLALLIVGMLTIPRSAMACSCAFVETFCESQTYGTDTISTPLIVYGENTRRENGGMRVNVIQVLHGQLDRPDLFIRNGNGADCGMGTDFFEIGGEFIFALYPAWQETEGEKEYMVSICGLNFLEVESGVVKGKIAPGVNSIPLEDFNTLANCGNLPPIVNGGLEIRLGPNPTESELEFKVSLSGKISGTARFINAMGQEVRRVALSGEDLWAETVDVSNFAPGVYFVEIDLVARREVRKIVVQH